MIIKQFRSGNIGALMDEYERATKELCNLILSFSQNEFERILDKDTDDEDCRSIKTIMNHVIAAGYRYLNQINVFLKQETINPKFETTNPNSTVKELEKVLQLTSVSIQNNLYLSDEEILKTTMDTRWGNYNIEMMFEHAIVHVLRHRRQIEKLTQS